MVNFNKVLEKHTQIKILVFKVLVFLFPVFFGVFDSWHSSVLLLLVLLALSSCKVKMNEIRKDIKILLFFIAFMFLISAISCIASDDIYRGIKRLTKLSYLLGLFPMIMFVQRYKIDLSKTYAVGASLGILIMFLVSIYQVHYMGLPRAHGVTNPINFGNVALMHAFLAFGYYVSQESRPGFVFAVAVLALGIFISFLTLSRGGWVALPAVLPLAILFLWKKAHRNATIIFVLCMCLFVFGGYFYGDQVKWRVSSTVKNVELYMEEGGVSSSIGQRFAMWGLAIDIFKEKPFFGSGLGDFRHDAERMKKNGETNLVKIHNHAHNIFLEFLAMTGITGFLAMGFAVIILPGYFFLSRFIRSGASNKMFEAFGGSIVLVGFTVFGLSDTWLRVSPLMCVYVVSLLAFLSPFLSSEKPVVGVINSYAKP